MQVQSTWITVYVDLTDPICVIGSPANGTTVSAAFTLNWSVTDTGTGYHYAEILVDGILVQTVNFPTTQVLLTGLVTGDRNVTVTVYDWAGRSHSDQILVTVQATGPGIPGFPFEAIAIGAILALGIGLVSRKKKKR